MKHQNPFDLKNKIALVTGGTGYLGIAICEGLANNGAEVYLTGKSEEKLLKIKNLPKTSNGKIHTAKMDISSQQSIDNCVKAIMNKHKKIDILVNNAFFSSSSSFEKISEKEWQKGLDGTINGVFRTTKSVLPVMKKNHNGSIINISSIYGIVSPDPSIYEGTSLNINPPDYGAGKAAIIQFSKYIGCQYAQNGIRVNSIIPGAFPNKTIQKDKKFISKLIKKIPMNRIGYPTDLEGLIVFLASDSSSYITAQNFVIDGGMTSW